MKSRSVLVGAVAAVGLLVSGAASASANIEWCLADPPVQLSTAAGTNLTVNVSVAVPQGEVKYINDVKVDAVTQAYPSGGTLIAIDVTVPSTVSVANVTATVKKYKVSTSASVPSGSTTTIYLVVPTT
jgi:hypothetical protein